MPGLVALPNTARAHSLPARPGGPHTAGYGVHTSHRACRRPPGAPLLREAGKVSPKATDGVWKAGRLDRKFAVRFVQAVWRRCSGPHPIGASRHLPQQAGEGVRAAI